MSIDKKSSIAMRVDMVKLARNLLLIGMAFALVGSYLWYSRLYMTDERRFWLAIENSMSVPSVTRTLTSGGTGNKAVQKQQFLFSPNVASLSKVEFDQRSATQSTSVVTEGMSFMDAQYSRYTVFDTNQTTESGERINLDDLLGKWEENVAVGDDAEQMRLTYISELVTLVIFGNFDADFRNAMLSEMKDNDVYGLSLNAVTEQEVDGDIVLQYPANIKLKPFVELLNRAFEYEGYGDFPPLDPTNYADDSPPLPVQISVSKKRGVVTSVTYGSRQESYSGHGIIKDIERPEATFQPGELEQQVQEKLQGVI